MWVTWQGKSLRVPPVGERKKHHSKERIYEVVVVSNLISTTPNSTEESRAKFPPKVTYRLISEGSSIDPFDVYTRDLEFWETHFKELPKVMRA